MLTGLDASTGDGGIVDPHTGALVWYGFPAGTHLRRDETAPKMGHPILVGWGTRFAGVFARYTKVYG